MIRGITVTEDGTQIQRLAVSTKIAIGLPPNPAEGKKAHPTKLDHFIFLRKSTVEQNRWEIDPELTKLFGAKCKSVEIVLLDDDVENVFPTKLAWFTQSACKCFGNGITATRRTEKHPEGEPWTPCGPSCPDLERGDCRASGDLRFMLAAMPKLGSVVRIHTSSIRSIQQISSSLQQIQTLLGGRLAGIRCNLVVRPEKTSFMGEDQKRHATTIHALNLEIQSEGIHALISKMTDHARLFEQTKKLLGGGRIEIIEPDEERAPEISAEFYPASAIAPAVKFPEPEEAEEVIPAQKQPNMDVMCQECRQVNGHKPDCFYATQQPATSDRSTKCGSCNAPPNKPHATTCPERNKPSPVAAKPSEPTIPATQETVQPQTAASTPQTTPQATEEAPAGLQTMPLQVLGLAVKEKPIKKNGKLTGEKQSYRVLTVLDSENLQWSLYAWDTKHFEFLDPIPAKTNCIFQVSKSKSGDTVFYSIEHIVETGGLKFVDDKPVIEGEVVEAEDEDMSLFDEPTPEGE
jgi:hypothetical protein